MLCCYGGSLANNKWRPTAAVAWPAHIGDCRGSSSAAGPHHFASHFALPAPPPPSLSPQVVSMFLPRVNLERRAAWYKDGEPEAMSPVDAQVVGWRRGGVA